MQGAYDGRRQSGVEGVDTKPGKCFGLNEGYHVPLAQGEGYTKVIEGAEQEVYLSPDEGLA